MSSKVDLPGMTASDRADNFTKDLEENLKNFNDRFMENLTKSANNVEFWRRKSLLKGIHVLFFSVGLIPTLGESRVLGSMQEAVHGPKCGLMPFHPPSSTDRSNCRW